MIDRLTFIKFMGLHAANPKAVLDLCEDVYNSALTPNRNVNGDGVQGSSLDDIMDMNNQELFKLMELTHKYGKSKVAGEGPIKYLEKTEGDITQKKFSSTYFTISYLTGKVSFVVDRGYDNIPFKDMPEDLQIRQLENFALIHAGIDIGSSGRYKHWGNLDRELQHKVIQDYNISYPVITVQDREISSLYGFMTYTKEGGIIMQAPFSFTSDQSRIYQRAPNERSPKDHIGNKQVKLTREQLKSAVDSFKKNITYFLEIHKGIEKKFKFELPIETPPTKIYI